VADPPAGSPSHMAVIAYHGYRAGTRIKDRSRPSINTTEAIIETILIGAIGDGLLFHSGDSILSVVFRDQPPGLRRRRGDEVYSVRDELDGDGAPRMRDLTLPPVSLVRTIGVND
jgi:hypothetical protein